MRRAWVAALVGVVALVAACGEAVTRRSFVDKLIVLCAQVNEQIEGVDPTAEPGRYEEAISGLVAQARGEQQPEEKREDLDRMLTALGDAASRFAAAEEARQEGRDEEVESAVTEASQKVQEADTAAQEYGMPPMAKCDEVVSGEIQTPPLD